MSARSFWDAAAPLIAVTEKHPFLVAMVDGTLNLENFKYYVVQDALYLADFAACLRSLSKNPDLSAEDSERLKLLAKGAEEAEISLHEGFMKQWGISPQGATQMPNCLLYTSYMARIVATRPFAEGLAVLLPCFWVYMHVGKCLLALRAQLGESASRPPQYDAWIDMYGGEEFEKNVTGYIAMVDKVCASATSETLRAMEDHFIMSCKLEYMFWDQAQYLMKWPEIVSNRESSRVLHHYDSLS